MKHLKVTSDQIHCPSCGTVIPRGQTKCGNPNCRTKKPLIRKIKSNNKSKMIELH